MNIFKRTTWIIITCIFLSQCSTENKTDKANKYVPTLITIEKTPDEIKYEELNEYLKPRGLNVCSWWHTMEKVEDDCGKQADIKYPEGGGLKWLDYYKKLTAKEKNRLMGIYDISDSVNNELLAFGYLFCYNNNLKNE